MEQPQSHRKYRVDNTRMEVRRTGGAPNVAGGIEDEDALILPVDKLSTSATERVSQMLDDTPAFTDIRASVDLFQGPLMSPLTYTSAADLHFNESNSIVPALEELEAVDSSRPARIRGR